MRSRQWKARRRSGAVISNATSRLTNRVSRDLPTSTDATGDPDSLSIKRPFIGYPAVRLHRQIRTGARGRATQEGFARHAHCGRRRNEKRSAFTIPTSIASRSRSRWKRSRWITCRAFPGRRTTSFFTRPRENSRQSPAEDDYAAALRIPLRYRDVKVLHTGDELDLQAISDSSETSMTWPKSTSQRRGRCGSPCARSARKQKMTQLTMD